MEDVGPLEDAGPLVDVDPSLDADPSEDAGLSEDADPSEDAGHSEVSEALGDLGQRMITMCKRRCTAARKMKRRGAEATEDSEATEDWD